MAAVSLLLMHESWSAEEEQLSAVETLVNWDSVSLIAFMPIKYGDCEIAPMNKPSSRPPCAASCNATEADPAESP